MPRQSYEITRQKWADRIARFESSSCTIAQFCTTEGCSQASFYKWRRRMRAESSPIENPTQRTLAAFVPVELPDVVHEDGPTLAISPDHCTPPASTTVVSVELPGGIHLRIESPAGNNATGNNITDTQVTA